MVMRPSRALVLLISLFALTFSAIPAFAKGQDIVKLNADIEVSKDMVAGDVVAIGGNITVYGKVENSAVAVGGSVFLKPNAKVGKEVVVVGGNLVKDPTAEIGGKATQIYMPNFIPSFASILQNGWMALWATISVLVLLGFLGIAVLFAALIPEHMATVVNGLERSFLAMFLWGTVWVILIVPIAVLLAISLVGIILIPLEILLAGLAFIIGYVAAAVYIGKNILISFKKVPPPFAGAILGILVLFLVGFVPIIGSIIKAVFLVAGFGAVITSRFGTVK